MEYYWKIQKNNVSGDLAVWIHNFLSDRKQRVAVDGPQMNLPWLAVSRRAQYPYSL